MREKLINVDLPDDAKMRVVIILYESEGHRHCVKVASQENGGPDAEDTGALLQTLIEHLNIVLHLGQQPEADA